MPRLSNCAEAKRHHSKITSTSRLQPLRNTAPQRLLQLRQAGVLPASISCEQAVMCAGYQP
ncbi:hypothetical protein KCP69_24890 [Salmonella enterica subsp. enterica]|nr:hypothetical protein KCP69_24890 [Salmonella enterica subsp. enterica]